MLNAHKFAITQKISAALTPLLPPQEVLPTITLDRPKQAEHGDLACNIALQLSKALKKNPRELAQALVTALLQDNADGLLQTVEIAGPGFINLRLSAAAKQSVVTQVLREGAAYGNSTQEAGKVMVEFVSANPTGPLHVGHGRQAALGDALCNLLASQGALVTREFYYNDAGNQINNLALSVQARVQGKTPEDADWPADGYRGEYIVDIARDFLAKKTVRADDRSTTASGDSDDFNGIRDFAVAYLRHEQDLDLQAFGVKFDHYYLESSLYTDGKVDATVSALNANGKTYEQDGALWLRSTEYGDDKDRVMRKSEGGYTYFVPDVAYHITKWQRGFARAINVQGTDHHGTIARVRAGLQAVGLEIPANYPEYALHSMVRVMRGGEEVKISKRAGSYVTLRDLIEWVGRDAVRFFLVLRKADTEFTFDIDLALSQSEENPVYYIQYAHARICSVWSQAKQDVAILSEVDLAPLTSAREMGLMQTLAEYTETLQQALQELAPHHVAFYLKELASAFHSYYNAERVLVDDLPVRQARLALLLAVRQVLRNGLGLLGVSAPEQMTRATQTDTASVVGTE